MFNNPLKKYANGGPVSESEAANEVKTIIAQITGASIDQIDSILGQIGQNDEAISQLRQLLQGASHGDEQSIQELKQLFNPQTQFAKDGGKLHDFICKHAKGGNIKDCGCDGSVKKAQGGSKIYGPITTDSTGTFRDFYYPEGGYAGRVNLKTGKAYQAETGEEMLQPGRYNRKGYPIAEGASTNGTYYEVNPYGRIIVNIPEGGQQVLHGNDSTAVANKLIKQWNMVKIGPAVTTKEQGGFIEMNQTGGSLISRKDALNASMANKGFNASQARYAYANAKNALRNQGLRGRELRQQARQMIIGDRPQIEAIPSNVLTDELFEQRSSYPTLAGGSLTSQLANNSKQIRDYTGSFNDAFASARNNYLNNNGANVFRWNGNLYNTDLAETLPQTETTPEVNPIVDRMMSGAIDHFSNIAPSTIGAVNYDGYSYLADKVRSWFANRKKNQTNTSSSALRNGGEIKKKRTL